MIMNKTNQDRIDAYLQGYMAAKDIPAFEKDVEKDDELRQQLFFSKNLQYVIQSRNDKLKMMKKWEKDYTWVKGKEKYNIHPPKRPLYYWISGIAAVLLSCVFLFKKVVIFNTTDKVPYVEEVVSTYSAKDNSDILYMIEHKKYQEAMIVIKDRSYAIERAAMEKQNVGMEKEDIDKYNKMVKDKQDELKWLEIQILPNMDREDAALNLLDELRKADGNYQLLADSLYRYMKN